MDDNHFGSVGAIVLHKKKVLLVRHTYGSAAGKLLNPGGMIKQGEMPYDAIKREVLEETGISVEPIGLIAVRCSATNWYLVFLCNHISGEPKSDSNENNEVLYMDCSKALKHSDLTDTAKSLLHIALNGKTLPMQDARKGRIMFSVGDVQ